MNSNSSPKEQQNFKMLLMTIFIVSCFESGISATIISSNQIPSLLANTAKNQKNGIEITKFFSSQTNPSKSPYNSDNLFALDGARGGIDGDLNGGLSGNDNFRNEAGAGGSVFGGVAGDGNIISIGTINGGAPYGENIERTTKDNVTLYKWQSFQATTPGLSNSFICQSKFEAFIKKPDSDNDKKSCTWRLIPGLAKSDLYSIESQDYPGQVLRHRNWRLILSPDDGTFLFKADATFYIRSGKLPEELRFESYNYPGNFIRHYNSELWVANSDGSRKESSPTLFTEDSTWKVGDNLLSDNRKKQNFGWGWGTN